MYTVTLHSLSLLSDCSQLCIEAIHLVHGCHGGYDITVTIGASTVLCHCPITGLGLVLFLFGLEGFWRWESRELEMSPAEEEGALAKLGSI